MRIAEIKIRNFRKLKEVTIQLQDDKTVFIGANNSGKTSAMVAMRYFLKQDDHSKFSIYDFTLSNHARIKEIGNKLEAESQKMPEGTSLKETEEFQLLWKSISPSLDLWFDVNDDDIHYVYHILPTLDWAGGNLGIRLQFELSDPAVFYGEYKEARERIKEIKAKAKNNRDILETNLFPKDIFDFLKEKLNNYFTVKFYMLDPSKKDEVQLTETLGEPMDSNPLSGLIQVDEINAQRGLNDEIAGTSFINERRLSKQLTDYYDQHLDPAKVPTEHDLDALAAIYEAQKIFHDSMTQRFQPALNELGELGYPGFYNPNITINPDIKATDGLDHNSALQYELDNCKGSFLPETYNGLGYQNLIFIAFELISFRDSWLKFGKQRVEQPSKKSIEYPPIHLVLVEEPEAHLHPQAQQVFIKQAYRILTCREEAKTGKLKTQLVITTHSSHITHECDFAHLRYFKRVPPKDKQVQGTEVVNLSNVFGSDNDTKKFVSRYIKLTHCDLFFADTAILIEGDAERILLPSFISRFAYINQSYVSILSIGGSHAHKLRPIMETLSIPALIITDLDAEDDTGGSAPVRRGANQVTNNDTLKSWFPGKKSVDDLLALSLHDKEQDKPFPLRVAFQTPIMLNGAEILPYTFEDSLIFENKALLDGITKAMGMIKKAKGMSDAKSAFDVIRNGNFKKAEFALELLYLPNFNEIKIPAYISEGLEWLEIIMKQKLTPTPLVPNRHEV